MLRQIQTESGNRRGMHPEIEKALLTQVNEIHAQGVNVSSKMIKEMGISILGRVNGFFFEKPSVLHLAHRSGFAS